MPRVEAQGSHPAGNHGHRVAEHVSDPDPQSRPEQHAHQVIESEPDASNRDNAGQRGDDRRQARDELGDQHRADAKAGEEVLSPPHAEIGLE